MKSNGCSMVVEDTTFTNNFAHGNGAAILLVSESELELLSSTFTSNTADGNGGGIMCDRCVKFKVDATEFFDNQAAKGGALALTDLPALPADNQIVSTKFDSNTAKKGGGGAIYREGNVAPLLGDGVVFTNNKALYGNDQATEPVKAVVRWGPRGEKENGKDNVECL